MGSLIFCRDRYWSGTVWGHMGQGLDLLGRADMGVTLLGAQVGP